MVLNGRLSLGTRRLNVIMIILIVLNTLRLHTEAVELSAEQGSDVKHIHLLDGAYGQGAR